MSTELCPICIENPGINFTECNHGFCIGCLSRIKKCAMCRNPLQRAKLCIQIQANFNLNEERSYHHEIHTFMEITLPHITYIRRNFNTSPRSITRIIPIRQSGYYRD
jgi:hypothetical protein